MVLAKCPIPPLHCFKIITSFGDRCVTCWPFVYPSDPTNGPGFDDDGRAIDEEDDDGSGGDLSTKPVNDEAGGQGGADENDDGSGENKEMADAGAGASGSVVRGAD